MKLLVTSRRTQFGSCAVSLRLPSLASAKDPIVRPKRVGGASVRQPADVDPHQTPGGGWRSDFATDLGSASVIQV